MSGSFIAVQFLTYVSDISVNWERIFIPILYGEIKTDEDIRSHVLSYVKSIKESKHDRFHAIMSLIPSGGRAVLDFGCWWGQFVIAMRVSGNSVEQ